MKIKLDTDLPLEPKHGATKGREFVVTRVDLAGRHTRYFFKGDADEECAAYKVECSIIEGSESEFIETEITITHPQSTTVSLDGWEDGARE